MHIDGYIQAIREDLARMAALGDEPAVRAAELLAVALDSALARRMQEALAEAALELSGQIPDGHVEVRIAGGDPELVYVGESPTPRTPSEPGDEGTDARITLRLSERLKSRLEEAAGAAGVSVNTWLVQTLTRALEPQSSTRGRSSGGRRLSGYGRA